MFIYSTNYFENADSKDMDWLQYFRKKYFNWDFLSHSAVYVLPLRALNMSETTWFLFHKLSMSESVLSICFSFDFSSDVISLLKLW
jgi:hypothetical protein